MRENVFYINNKRSDQLEDHIERLNSFEEFERAFPDEFLAEDCRIGNYVEQIMWKYEKDYATVSRAAGFSKGYVGNLIGGTIKKPSRDALISICLATGTTAEEVQYLLKYAGYAPLYVRRKRDVIIWFGFMKGRTLDEVDMDLYDRGYKTLKKRD